MCCSIISSHQSAANYRDCKALLVTSKQRYNNFQQMWPLPLSTVDNRQTGVGNRCI